MIRLSPEKTREDIDYAHMWIQGQTYLKTKAHFKHRDVLISTVLRIKHFLWINKWLTPILHNAAFLEIKLAYGVTVKTFEYSEIS